MPKSDLEKVDLLTTYGLMAIGGGLLILGKTAKEGTWWGNLAAVGTMFVGMSGMLLAAAIWATA